MSEAIIFHCDVEICGSKIKKGTFVRQKEWVELDVNEVVEVIHKNIPNPTPELLDKLYGLVADIDLWLQEKNA